jgi:Core-2/I-Branching enzyme
MSKPIAYLVLAHADPQQCARLVKRLLCDEKAHVFLHVDRKARSDFSPVGTLDPARVHMVQERYRVSWSGFSTVRAILTAMREALSIDVTFGYLVLLSGMDYPLKHPGEISRYLHEQPFRQHINRVNVRDSPEHYLKLAKRYTFRDAWLPAGKLDKLLRKLATIAVTPVERKLLAATICTGSSWWALTPDCGRFILNFAAEHEEYNRFFKYVHCPEEHYFHTIVQNSPFSGEAAPILTYSGRGMWKTANLHVIHPSLRKIYTDADFDEVMRANRCFVRKVMTALSTTLLDKIDVEVGCDKQMDACEVHS